MHKNKVLSLLFLNRKAFIKHDSPTITFDRPCSLDHVIRLLHHMSEFKALSSSFFNLFQQTISILIIAVQNPSVIKAYSFLLKIQ